MSGRKSGGGGGMKFSFKTLEEDEEDEENLTSVTGELKKPSSSIPRSATTEEKVGDPHRASRSQETVRNPKIQTPSKSLEEDRISSLKSKFRHNFSDIKAKVVKKIEDIHSEFASSPENEAEKSLEGKGEDVPSDEKKEKVSEEKKEKGAEHAENETNINVKSVMDDQPEEGDVLKKGKEERSSELDKGSEQKSSGSEKGSEQKFSDSGKERERKSSDLSVDDQEEFQMIDDFYETEDITALSASTSSLPTSPEIRYRNKSLPQKLKPKGKGISVVSSAPVSLSNIRQHTQVQDLVLEPPSVPKTGEKEEEFHDVNNQNVSAATGAGVPLSNSGSTPTSKQTQQVPWKNIGIASVAVTLYWLIPLPSYISGFMMGVLLTTLCCMAYVKLNKPPTPKPEPKILPLIQLPPFIIPEMKDVKTEDYVFKGWMNEIVSYDPFKYSINDTHVVQVLLDGTRLRLRRTKANIPKRAVWDEFIPNVTEFIHGRHYDILGSRVYLLPIGLVQKRIWSKKYPICIELPKKDQQLKKSEGSQSDTDLSKVKESLGIVKKESSEMVKEESFHGFEVISGEKCDDNTIYLFTRTCREKEDWFKRFQAAAAGKPLKSNLGRIRKYFETKVPLQRKESNDGTKQHQRRESTGSLSESQDGAGPTHTRQDSTDSVPSIGSTPNKESDVVGTCDDQEMEQFVSYMSKLMPRELYDRFTPGTRRGGPRDSNMIDCEEQVLWVNALISRCFWDFLRHQKYANWVKDKIQKKLEKIHVPYFIEKLKLTDINLGSVMPVIRRASRPYFDENGLWVNLAVNYGGGFKMTIETKVNLMKLREVELRKAERELREKEKASKKLAITDENEEDSAESSTDDEEDSSVTGSSEEGGKKKFMNILGKITQSKYFKSATEIKYVKKAMEGVSNTPLILTVECRFLSGELGLNIPFPPTDRLWYGFHGNPKLSLVAKPKVGAREVTVSYITEWIEKKLTTEFQRVVVMPNMDDLTVPILLPEYTMTPPIHTSKTDPELNQIVK